VEDNVEAKKLSAESANEKRKPPERFFLLHAKEFTHLFWQFPSNDNPSKWF
jgi:hypothetical protein